MGGGGGGGQADRQAGRQKVYIVSQPERQGGTYIGLPGRWRDRDTERERGGGGSYKQTDRQPASWTGEIASQPERQCVA